jgi:hypothetical protein
MRQTLATAASVTPMVAAVLAFISMILTILVRQEVIPEDVAAPIRTYIEIFGPVLFSGLAGYLGLRMHRVKKENSNGSADS